MGALWHKRQRGRKRQTTCAKRRVSRRRCLRGDSIGQDDNFQVSPDFDCAKINSSPKRALGAPYAPLGRALGAPRACHFINPRPGRVLHSNDQNEWPDKRAEQTRETK